jgi:bifunctional DNA-binding transcriptional regulator/antitoxin component of YhaV-PrlF toxin-antitoxin module
MITKTVKVSKNRQIAIPKDFNIEPGERLVLEFDQKTGKLVLTTVAEKFKQKLKKFKPVSLKTNQKVNFSETHDEIYD